MGQSVYINFDTENLRSARCRGIDDLRNQKFTQFVVGDSIELDLYLTGTDGALNIQDYSEIRLGMGNLDARPESGSYQVDGSQTLAYNHSASDLQTAVASIASSNVTTELTGFVFKIQFDAVGAQNIPSIDVTLLQPRSTVSVTKLVTGDATTKEVWLWRVFRDPLAFTNTFTNIADNGVRGTLSLATAGLYELIAQSSSVKTFFEVELTSSDGNVRTVLQAQVDLNGEVIGHNFSGSIPVSPEIPAAAYTFLSSFPNPEIAGDLTVNGDLESKSDAIVTDGLTVDTDTLVIEPNNNYVGINKAIPTAALDVVGDVEVTGEVDANSVQANNYYGGLAAFAATSISGDLTVNGNATTTGNLGAGGNLGVSGDLSVSGQISSSQKIDCPQILATIGKIGDVELTSSGDLLIKSGATTYVKLASSGLTLSESNTSFVKENCYYKSGAVRLQKSDNIYDEILLRYEGQTSDNFVIQQWHSGEQAGQIKFLGNTPSSSNTLRLDAENVDVGFSNTVLTKIFSDTNFGAYKKFVFKDSRDATDGLHFEHTGNNAPSIQLGMYGDSNDADFGQFKITHTDSSDVNTNVIVVDKDNGYTKLESEYTEMKNAKVADGGYTQFGSLTTTERDALTAANGMVIYNTTDNKFQGRENGAWVNLV